MNYWLSLVRSLGGIDRVIKSIALYQHHVNLGKTLSFLCRRGIWHLFFFLNGTFSKGVATPCHYTRMGPLVNSRKILRWRHNERDDFSLHLRRDGLLNRYQTKHQSSAWLAFVRGIHWWPVNYPHKGPVTRKMFPFDDVIMIHYKNWNIGQRCGIIEMNAQMTYMFHYRNWSSTSNVYFSCVLKMYICSR